MSSRCKVYRNSLPPAKPGYERAALLGSFDGLHIGHQHLLSVLRDWKEKDSNRETVVVSFYPHPVATLKNVPVPQLSSLKQNTFLLGQYNTDFLALLHFSDLMASLSAEEFIDSIIIEKLGIDVLYIGPDAAVGKNRGGDSGKIAELMRNKGRQVTVVPFLNMSGKKVGSRIIREKVKSGDLSEVKGLLGRPYQICGYVVDGRKLGRTIGVPTANVAPGKFQVPKLGVYATMVHLRNRLYKAVTNVGVKPTVGSDQVIIESHLLNYTEGDFYGSVICIDFHAFLREEKEFSDINLLASQIRKDIDEVMNVFN